MFAFEMVSWALGPIANALVATMEKRVRSVQEPIGLKGEGMIEQEGGSLKDLVSQSSLYICVTVAEGRVYARLASQQPRKCRIAYLFRRRRP